MESCQCAEDSFRMTKGNDTEDKMARRAVSSHLAHGAKGELSAARFGFSAQGTWCEYRPGE